MKTIIAIHRIDNLIDIELSHLEKHKQFKDTFRNARIQKSENRLKKLNKAKKYIEQYKKKEINWEEDIIKKFKFKVTVSVIVR